MESLLLAESVLYCITNQPAAAAELLAPDIQEAILEGRQPKGVQLEELTGHVPSAWEEQRPLIVVTSGFSGGPRTTP